MNTLISIVAAIVLLLLISKAVQHWEAKQKRKHQDDELSPKSQKFAQDYLDKAAR